MDVVKFRAFCTVARLRSISKAAETLYYTQPAISTQIRELENAYGARLFRRTGKRLELTDAGTTLLPIAEQLLKLFDESRMSVQHSSEQESRFVRLGASTMPGIHVVPQLVADFMAAHPEYRLSLTINNAFQIERMMTDNDIDVAILGRAVAATPSKRLAEIELFEDPLVLVVGVGHPLAGHAEVDPEVFKEHPLILPPRGILTRKAVEDRLRQLGVSLTLAHEITNAEAIKRLVVHGLGITILCRSVVEAEAAAGWVQAIPVRGLELARKVCLSYPVDKNDNPAIQDIIAFVRSRYPQAKVS